MKSRSQFKRRQTRAFKHLVISAHDFNNLPRHHAGAAHCQSGSPSRSSKARMMASPSRKSLLALYFGSSLLTGS